MARDLGSFKVNIGSGIRNDGLDRSADERDDLLLLPRKHRKSKDGDEGPLPVRPSRMWRGAIARGAVACKDLNDSVICHGRGLNRGRVPAELVAKPVSIAFHIDGSHRLGVIAAPILIPLNQSLGRLALTLA